MVKERLHGVQAQCGMRQYICRSTRAQALYVALSVFHDVFGEKYTKPIYIEKNSFTSSLHGRCQVKKLLDRDFYSLIKTPQGTYRFNADIYQDAHRILGLPFEIGNTLGYGLMSICSDEIESTILPSDAYLRAKAKNDIFRLAVSHVARAIPMSEDSFGLIGSLAVNPKGILRDIDLVFSGDSTTLETAYRWIREGPRDLSRLSRRLPESMPPICAFFTSCPVAYPDLSNFQVLRRNTSESTVMIGPPVSPPYLNMQIFSARTLPKGRTLVLVVRDTLSRCGLNSGQTVHLYGFESRLNGKEAILITDVEKQISEVSFHS